ncbi:MAG: inositol monophosphatase [bacterium]
MYTTFLEFATTIAKKAGEELMTHYGKTDTATRDSSALKTSYDLAADQILVKAIETTFPDHSYLTEETGKVTKGNEYLWIIDPLDGTRNFVNNNPFFAVSIALWQNGEPVVAVIEAPALQERYVAVKGQGATLIRYDEQQTSPAHVSTTTKLEDAYAVYCFGGSYDRAAVYKGMEEIHVRAKDTRLLGSAALELAWVGTGRADYYATPNIALWDIAAGVLFVTEAGGKVTNFLTKEYAWNDIVTVERCDLVATNGRIAVPEINLHNNVF